MYDHNYIIKATARKPCLLNRWIFWMLQAQIASTAYSPEVGRLLLKHLCPAVHALLLDGLKPQVRSLFGKMKNSIWKVVEDSSELGWYSS